MGIGFDENEDKGLFSHLGDGGFNSGYPPQQIGGNGYDYPPKGYPQTAYPASGHSSGCLVAHAYPASTAQYHSGYGGHGMNGMGMGFISGESNGHGGYGSYGWHQGKINHGYHNNHGGGKYGNHKMWE